MKSVQLVSFAIGWAALGLLGCSAGSAPPAAGDETSGDVAAETTPTTGDDTGAATEDTATPPGEDTSSPPVDTGGPVEPAPEYPPGPYGKIVGAVMPNLTFQGYRSGVGTYGPLKLGDYYDPDGKRNVKAIRIMGSLTTCSRCQAEQMALVKTYADLRSRGGVVLTTIMSTSKSGIDAWVTKFKPTNDVCIDPSSTILPGAGSFATPYDVLIDPRTMKVTKTLQNGNTAAEAELERLITVNSR